MIEYNPSEWVTPARAAEEMGRLAGYKITVDDIRQLKRIGRIKRTLKLNDRITLYSLQEIRSVNPPKKRKREPFQADQDKSVA